MKSNLNVNNSISNTIARHQFMVVDASDILLHMKFDGPFETEGDVTFETRAVVAVEEPAGLALHRIGVVRHWLSTVTSMVEEGRVTCDDLESEIGYLSFVCENEFCRLVIPCLQKQLECVRKFGSAVGARSYRISYFPSSIRTINDTYAFYY